MISLFFINDQTHEKKPRESILRAEFANAIDIINKDLSGESRLRFLHWDLHKHFQRLVFNYIFLSFLAIYYVFWGLFWFTLYCTSSKATNVLQLLAKVAAYALALTGFFYCQATPTLRLEESLNWPTTEYVFLLFEIFYNQFQDTFK